MQYEVVKNSDCKHRWKDNNGWYWPYISISDAEDKELDLNKIFGDVGNKKGDSGDILQFLGRTITLTTVKVKLARKERIIGYIPCQDKYGVIGYSRIIEKKRKKVIWLPFLMALLLLLGGGLWVLNQNPKVDLDDAAISYQMPNGMKNENPSEIMMPVFTELTLPSGSSKVSAGLVNPEGNPCYFKYRVYLKENNELLYESKWLKPGTAILEFKVKQKMKAGEYPIVISIKTGSLKDPEIEMNGGEVDSILRVE